MKTCTKCDEAKPPDEFHKDGSCPDGLRRWCKSCARAQALSWSRENKDRLAASKLARRESGEEGAYQRRWVAANPGRQAAYVRKHRNKDRAAFTAKQRARYAANPEIGRGHSRRWRERNPEAVEASWRSRRARRKAAFVHDVDPLVVLEMTDGACGICGGDVDPDNFHMDHVVPLARGGLHARWNVQAAHPACNLAKSDEVGFTYV